jgi:hypothetical protein
MLYRLLEKILGTRATRQAGTSRIQDDVTLANRVSAIHYTISHDDGTGINDNDEEPAQSYTLVASDCPFNYSRPGTFYTSITSVGKAANFIKRRAEPNCGFF